MANKNISQLPAASQMNDSDLLVCEQNGVAKRLAGSVLMAMINSHGGITGTSYTPPANLHTDGDINAGAVIYDFPLYDVFINGTSIESIVPRFTALPDGGRLGEIEAAFQNVLNEFEEVQEVVNNLPQDISQAASKDYVDNTQELKEVVGKVC